MRPVEFRYTPADDNLTGFASNVTGASWPLTATTPGDGLAHQVTIRNDSATDHSAKTALLTGTDADGLPQTEIMSLPAGSATTTSTRAFRTLTSVVPSATIGADTMDIGWNDVCTGPTYPLNWRQANFQISLGVDVSGTINYTIQHCLEDIRKAAPSTLTWWPHATLVNRTVDMDGNYASPVTATRLRINSLTDGATIEFQIVQGV